MCETNLKKAVVLLGAVLLVGTACGCAGQVEMLARQLDSVDPAERIRAVHAVGTKRVEGLIPALIDRLDDVDPAVRLFTIIALEKLTGERFGYKYASENHVRRASIEKWRRFVAMRVASVVDGRSEGCPEVKSAG